MVYIHSMSKNGIEKQEIMQTQLQSWGSVQLLELETSQRGKEKSRCFFKRRSWHRMIKLTLWQNCAEKSSSSNLSLLVSEEVQRLCEVGTPR